MRRNSPRTGCPSILSDIFWERSPSATASRTRETSMVGRTRSSIIELTELIDSAHVPFAFLNCARSVIRPSRPMTLLTRLNSLVRPSRLSAKPLKAFATSPMTPLFCADSRTPVSPSLAERRASSSSCKSFFLISTVALSVARRFRAGALRFCALRSRVLGSGAATGDSFVRGMVCRMTVGRRVCRLNPRVSRSGAKILLARARIAWKFQCLSQIRPEVFHRLQAYAQAEQAWRDTVPLPAGSGLEERGHAAQARGVPDQAKRGLDVTGLVGADDGEGEEATDPGIAAHLDRGRRFQA